MVRICNFKDLVARLKEGNARRKVAVVEGKDASTLHAVSSAIRDGFAEVVFVGKRADVEQAPELADLLDFVSFEETTSRDESARRAVELVRQGKAEILMKGLINTDNLLRAVLDKEHGLLPAGRVLTHLAVAEIPGFKRLLFFTDAAVIPYPTHEQRLAQVAYAAELCRAFGIERPRISLLHCSEKVSEKFPHTAGYADIIRRAQMGEWGSVIVDGPLDVKTSVSAEDCAVKGISSPLEGEADALVFPDIEAGNTFYKTISFFAKANMAGILQGCICPVVLTSRADSTHSKYLSLAMAAAASN